jgi:DNA-directed RNA polymerase subunit RPC12/RpoP
MPRLKCPQCGSEDTWAKYVHDPCPNSTTGKTEWEVAAEGATPDGMPFPKPCPTPLDGTMTNAAEVRCGNCDHKW